MKQKRMALVPVTAELLSEMDAIEVMGGNVDLPVTTYAKTEECTIYSKCTMNSSCNTYCSGANCIAECFKEG